MTDHLVSPDRQITIAGQSFTLDGSFRTLKALQHAFTQDILFVQARILEMRQDEIARLIAVATGAKEDDIGSLLLDEVDITGTDYLMLKAELLAWLAVAMTPRRDREKKAVQMAEVIEKLRNAENPASPGGSIRSSSSASSAGPRKRSGKATSGR